MNKPQLSEKSSKPTPQPVLPSTTRLLVARILLGLLLGMVFVALFGDFVAWAFYGTKAFLSPKFHRMDSVFAGVTGFFVLLFIAQAKTDWNQGKRHLVLVGIFTIILGAIPIAQPCALTVRFATVRGTAALFQPKVTLVVIILLIILACKCKAVSNIWQFVGPAFKAQDERRIVISK